MAWDNNGPSGPWGQRPSTPHHPQEDFDELLRKGKERFKKVFSGGDGGEGPYGNRKAIMGILGVIAVLWLLSGFYVVAPAEEAVVMRFGEYNRTASPGLRYHLPQPFEKREVVPVTVINQEIIGARSTSTTGRQNVAVNTLKERLVLTGDLNIVDVNFVVQWRINNAREYVFNVRNLPGENTVKNAAESAMREVIGQVPLNAVLAQERFKIEQDAKTSLQTILDSYKAGVEVQRVQLQDSDPPMEVIDAFRNVEAARAEKETKINVAERYRNKIIPEARGEVEQILQKAEAYQAQVVSLAQGEAERFISVYNTYLLNKEVVRKRMYLETMEKVMNGMNKIVVEGKNGTQGVLPYLPLSALQNTPKEKAVQ